MNESNLVSDGLLLMLIGMGMVFVFLTVLVLLTGLIHRVFGESEKTVSPISTKSINSADEVAAVSAAVYAYRNKTRNFKE